MSMSDPTPMIESILGMPPAAADLAAKAKRCLDGVHDWQAEEGMTDATMITVALEAQTHATLYLAEQQRLANIIAWQQLTGESNRAIVRRGLGLWTPDEKDQS